jgi:hypothetical protein
MKKTHLIILIITAMMALFSAYSLAAINQVYNINFEWYSQYRNCFTSDGRDTSSDKWSLDNYPKNIWAGVISSNTVIDGENEDKPDLSVQMRKVIDQQDMEQYVVIACSLGDCNSIEYRIKVLDIAQRGNVVEVKVSLNSPTKADTKDYMNETDNEKIFKPIDVIRVKKETFSSKGGLYFIFKTQSGKQLFEKYYEIK